MNQLELKDIDAADPEYVSLLKRIITIQADCEVGGPHLYLADILPGAPSKVDQLVVARTAAEEVDHFRLFSRLANELGIDTAPLLSKPNTDRFVSAFRGRISTWEDYVVFGFLIDRIGRYQLEEFEGASYAPLARILEHPSKVMEEEAGHIDFGETRTAEMAARGGEAKERVQRAVNHWYIQALDMFGESRSQRSERFIHWGLKRRTNEEARQLYMAEVNPLITAMGLTVPDPMVGRRYL